MYLELNLSDPDWAPATVASLEAFAGTHAEELREARRSGTFLRDLYREMGRHGWVGPSTPAAHGGAGGGVAEYCLIEEEVGRLGLIPPQVSIQGQRWLLEWGSAEQQDRYLEGMATGEIVFSESISEPGVGSALHEMTSTARRDGSDWILRGHKTHVNLGSESDVTLVYAMAPEGLTAFFVDTDLPGVSRWKTDPVGLRLIPTADVVLDEVRVPDAAVLGEVGKGIDTFFTTFNISRLGNASELIGLARRALGDGLDYAKARRVGEAVVADFQGLRWIAADMFGELYGASLARDRAANMADRDEDHALETSLAKKLAIEASEMAMQGVFSLVGGHGLYHDTEYVAISNDVKVLRIAGGSLEILRNHIAKRLVQSSDYEGIR